MSAPIVVFDACVLFSAKLRDLLMRLTLAEFCQARWSDAILDEWTRSVGEKYTGISPTGLARCRELMNRHIGDALVVGFEPLIPTLTLPDPDDRHVLAAAIHSQAKAIVTFNLKDFPENVLSVHGIEAIHPDDFLLRFLHSDPATVCGVLHTQRSCLVKPPVNAEDFLDALEQCGLPLSAKLLREHKDIL